MTAANGLTEADYRLLEQTWISRQFADDTGIPSIQAAERALAEELKSRGAAVRLIDLPDLPNLNQTGADDCLAHPDGEPERLLAIIAGAKPAEPDPQVKYSFAPGFLN